MHKATIYLMINQIPHLEGKFDLLDTILCLTQDEEIVKHCNEIMRELLQGNITKIEEVI